jgi:hypothetical protein
MWPPEDDPAPSIFWPAHVRPIQALIIGLRPVTERSIDRLVDALTTRGG